jgi:hypothetical protein
VAPFRYPEEPPPGGALLDRLSPRTQQAVLWLVLVGTLALVVVGLGLLDGGEGCNCTPA